MMTMENSDQDEKIVYPDKQDNQQPETINDPSRGIDLYTFPLQLTFNENTSKTDLINKIICGDCEKILKDLPDNSVDLIITSPPYADQRDATYGGIKPDQYVSWFMPRADQFYRVLKPSGSFILNIKERVVNGERHTYVMELIIEMRKHQWLWTEENMWHKKNSHPGKWPNRFRDNWERLIHFTKNRRFQMFQDEVMVPVGDWAQGRLKNLSETDKRRDNSRVGSGFGKNISNWVGRQMVYPSNVLYRML
jgi:site-specific DNA-methyltransferase (adenine-specific)